MATKTKWLNDKYYSTTKIVPKITMASLTPEVKEYIESQGGGGTSGIPQIDIEATQFTDATHIQFTEEQYTTIIENGCVNLNLANSGTLLVTMVDNSISANLYLYSFSDNNTAVPNSIDTAIIELNKTTYVGTLNRNNYKKAGQCLYTANNVQINVDLPYYYISQSDVDHAVDKIPEAGDLIILRSGTGSLVSFQVLQIVEPYGSDYKCTQVYYLASDYIKYKHNITISGGSNYLYFTLEIENNNNTAFTYDTLKTYLSDKGFNYPYLKGVNGTIYISNKAYALTGIYYDSNTIYISYGDAGMQFNSQAMPNNVSVDDKII